MRTYIVITCIPADAFNQAIAVTSVRRKNEVAESTVLASGTNSTSDSRPLHIVCVEGIIFGSGFTVISMNAGSLAHSLLPLLLSMTWMRTGTAWKFALIVGVFCPDATKAPPSCVRLDCRKNLHV